MAAGYTTALGGGGGGGGGNITRFVFFGRQGAFAGGQIIFPLAESAFVNSMPYLIPENLKVTGIEVVYGTHQSAAASTNTIEIREVVGNPNGLGAQIVSGSGVLVGFTSFITAGASAVAFYKYSINNTINTNITQGNYLTCFCSVNTAAVSDVIVSVKLSNQ